MLQQNNPIVLEHGFLVAVEIEQGVPTPYATPEAIALHIKDSVRFIEGVGGVDVHYMGLVEEVKENDQ